MKKTLLTILCTIIICSCVMSVTLAYLVDKTDTVKNTFTIGNISITLEETKGEAGNSEVGFINKTFKMLPGKKYAKDPIVTVEAGSEACWLFIEVKKTTGFDKYMECAIDVADDEWIALNGEDGVYYRAVSAVTADTPFTILKGEGEGEFKNGMVTIKSTLTNVDMIAVADNLPNITFTAYAVQQEGLTVQQAWEQAQNTANYSASISNS